MRETVFFILGVIVVYGLVFLYIKKDSDKPLDFPLVLPDTLPDMSADPLSREEAIALRKAEKARAYRQRRKAAKRAAAEALLENKG